MANERFLEMLEERMKLARLKASPQPTPQAQKKHSTEFFKLHVEKIAVIRNSGAIEAVRYGLERFFQKMNLEAHDMLADRVNGEALRYLIPVNADESGSNIMFNLWVNPNTVTDTIKLRLDISGYASGETLDFGKSLELDYHTFTAEAVERFVLEGIDAMMAFLIAVNGTDTQGDLE